MIVLIAGLPGTGKSTLAKALADRLAGTVLSKDDIRHAIFAPHHVEYSTVQDDFCMEIMLQAAEYIFTRDPSRFIFLDGRTFSRRYQIDRVIESAELLGQRWRVIECICSDATAKVRLEKDRQHLAGNRDYKLYLEVKARFEEIKLHKLVVNTDQPLDACVATALQYLMI